MAKSAKNQLAEQIEDLRVAFDLALSDKRKYRLFEFRAFVQCVRKYMELTADDPMIHKTVASTANGLRKFLQAERKRAPGNVLFEADRLECVVFAGYDSAFDADRQVFDVLR